MKDLSVEKELSMGGGYTLHVSIDTLTNDEPEANHRTAWLWMTKDGEDLPEGKMQTRVETFHGAPEHRNDVDQLRLMVKGGE